MQTWFISDFKTNFSSDICISNAADLQQANMTTHGLQEGGGNSFSGIG